MTRYYLPRPHLRRSNLVGFLKENLHGWETWLRTGFRAGERRCRNRGCLKAMPGVQPWVFIHLSAPSTISNPQGSFLVPAGPNLPPERFPALSRTARPFVLRQIVPAVRALLQTGPAGLVPFGQHGIEALQRSTHMRHRPAGCVRLPEFWSSPGWRSVRLDLSIPVLERGYDRAIPGRQRFPHCSANGPTSMVNHFQIICQDAQVGIYLGQGTAHNPSWRGPIRPHWRKSSLTRVR